MNAAPGGSGDAGAAPPPSLDNGLLAPRYVALTELDAVVGTQMLSALRRARIPAYLISTTAPDRRRLFVASEDRADARTVVTSVMRSLRRQADGNTEAGAPAPTAATPASAPTASIPTATGGHDAIDVDTMFEQLVADWRVDTVAAVRDAERDLTREDEDWRLRLNTTRPSDEAWLDEEHYVPPAPPPLPRLAAPTIIAVAVLLLSVLVLAVGGYVGLSDEFAVVLGIGGLILAAGIFFTRIAERRDDDDNDGSAV